MITTIQDVQDNLRRYEYENPEPLSRVPSAALRQVATDLRHVRVAGATLDMDDWCAMDPATGNCTVCLAGAVLLGRGSIRRCLQLPETRQEIEGDIKEELGCIELLPRGVASLENLESDGDARVIAEVFNRFREGLYGTFLGAWCQLPGFDALDLACEMAHACGSRVFRGRLQSEEIDELLQHLHNCADWLESKNL